MTLETTARLLGLDELTALQRLDTLVAKSLVVPVVAHGRVNGYRLLETIRAFGAAGRPRSGRSTACRPPSTSAAPTPGRDRRRLLRLPQLALQLDGEQPPRGHDPRRRRHAGSRTGRLDRPVPRAGGDDPTDPGGHGRMLSNARRLVEHGDELRDSAQVAARTAKMALETFTNRYLDTFETAREAQWRLGRVATPGAASSTPGG